jgi:tight adherence protein B
MNGVLGIMLGLGIVLGFAPLLWPASAPKLRPRPFLIVMARDRLVQAGLPRVGLATMTAVSVILAIGAGAITLAVVPVAAVAVAASVFALALPWTVVVRRARAQRRATRGVWPDVVDHLVSAIRSGLALPDSVVSLAHGGPEATRAAFATFERSYRTAGNFSDALDVLKDTLADAVADRIIETLRMSREVGGNELTLVLRDLAGHLRRDAGIRAEVEARQSWTVNAARLGVAAPWIILLLLSTRPEAASAYNSPSGALLIAIGLGVSVIAYRLMLALGRLPEERRWFG